MPIARKSVNMIKNKRTSGTRHFVTQYNNFFDPKYNKLLEKGIPRKEARKQVEKLAMKKFGYLYEGAQKLDMKNAGK